ncbi:MAG: hypothetical protein WAV89_05160 [Ignavibacteriaceae bacterium]
MSQEKDLQVLWDFYLYSDLNDEEYLAAYLKEKDLDIDHIALQLNEHFENLEAQQKLNEGIKFRENYLKIINDEKFAESENEVHSTADAEIIQAFRKSRGSLEEDDKDIADDIKKLKILKKLTANNQTQNDKKD